MGYSLRQNRANSGNYSRGRGGAKVNKIVIHHAATTDFDGIGRTFQAAGRNASAHYGVGRNNNVDQYVPEEDMAWHAGTPNPATNPNPSSIGIEHVNSSGAPDWNIAEETFNTSVELVRDIATRHGLLPLVVGQNLFQHKNFSNTYCAGKMGDRLQELADRVNSGTSTPTPPASGGKKSDDEIAQEVIDMKWGVNPDRANRLRAAGYNAEAVQALVNQKLGFGGGSAPAQSSGGSIGVGSTVEVTNPVDENGTRLSVSGQYSVMELKGSRAVIGRGGAVTAAINVANLRLVGGGSAPAQAPQPAQDTSINVGNNVTVANPVDWNGTHLGVSGVYSVMELNGARAVIGRGGVVTAAINVANLRRA